MARRPARHADPAPGERQDYYHWLTLRESLRFPERRAIDANPRRINCAGLCPACAIRCRAPGRPMAALHPATWTTSSAGWAFSRLEAIHRHRCAAQPDPRRGPRLPRRRHTPGASAQRRSPAGARRNRRPRRLFVDQPLARAAGDKGARPNPRDPATPIPTTRASPRRSTCSRQSGHAHSRPRRRLVGRAR